MEKKICGIATKPITIRSFMIGNLRYLAEKGYKSYCISNPGDELSKAVLGPVIFLPINMKWGNVSPIEVFCRVYEFYKIFKKEKITVIQYATANAGLYSAIAGWLARVPVRIFLQWGVAYPDYSGFKLWFYKFMEKLTCFFSTHIQPDSFANLNFAISEKLFKPSKGSVLYHGSACGVDLSRFDISKSEQWKKEIHDKYKLHEYKKILGYVGRIVPEKGLNELIEAFLNLKNSNNYALLLVGPTDDVDRLNQKTYNKSLGRTNIIFTGNVNNPEHYYAAFDFMVLPSYREGFGMVVLEAAAMGTPSIISNIKGPTDFVKDGTNGLICEVKSIDSLCEKLSEAVEMSYADYCTMQQNAYQTVKNDFDAEIFKLEFLKNRNQLLEEYERRNPSA